MPSALRITLHNQPGTPPPAGQTHGASIGLLDGADPAWD